MNKRVKSLLTYIQKETTINIESKGLIPTQKVLNDNNMPVRIDIVSLHHGLLRLGICCSNIAKSNSINYLKVIYFNDAYLDDTIAIQKKLLDATLLPVFIDKVTNNNE